MTSQRRPDLPDSLVHLTKPREPRPLGPSWQGHTRDQGDPGATAFEVLKEILTQSVIKARNGFVKGGSGVVSFSQIPLAAIRYHADAGGTAKRYSFCGILIPRDDGFKIGTRPVIYLPEDEMDWIPKQHLWRYVRYEPPNIDHTGEREWRVPTSIDLRYIEKYYILVANQTQAGEILQIYGGTFAEHKNVRGILVIEDLNHLV